MNKTGLIEYLAEEVELSKAMAGKVIDAVFDGIKKGLQEDGIFSSVGHGTYSVVERAAREGRNPQTGEKITIAASKSVKFKVGKELKDSVKA